MPYPARGAALLSLVMHDLQRLAGLLLMLLGWCGVLLSSQALMDPAGAQMANDADPFGTPPPTAESVRLLVCWVSMVLAGGWLRWRRPQPA